MSIQSTDQVARFADDPNSRTVTVFFKDGSSLILEQLSHGNYTNPPGYKDMSGTIEQYRDQLQQRKLSYYTALNSQLNT
jgi:hypothetical protein